MNVAAAAITIVTTIALKQCSDIKRIDCKSFDLSQLRLPHAFEHDNSMSREDSNNLTLNNWKFSQEIFNQVLNVWQNYTEITPALAHRARDVRVNDAHSRDIPGWFQENMQSSYIENAQYLLVFWDEQKKSARKDWIKYFFENERLPHYLGWRADQRMEISADASRAMAAQIAKAS